LAVHKAAAAADPPFILATVDMPAAASSSFEQRYPKPRDDFGDLERLLPVRNAEGCGRIGSMNLKILAFVLAATTGVMAASLVLAQTAESVRVRGTISKFEGSTLTVKTREGSSDAITLVPDWKVSGVAKASVDDIKVGDFVGIASTPTADGTAGALEVVIFPAALKGAGEGDRPWDLQPDSSMTNGTVADQVTGVDGPTVTLTYDNGQEKKISIPGGTPIVTFAPATPADLTPGAAVFVIAERDANGALTSGRVVVGNHGVPPPM
jgi:hypothetical protein